MGMGIEIRRLFWLILLVLLLSASHQEGRMVTEVAKAEGEVAEPARTCESLSHGFKGRCWSSHNCGILCKNEGFTGGWCRGARQRCFCTKYC